MSLDNLSPIVGTIVGGVVAIEGIKLVKQAYKSTQPRNVRTTKRNYKVSKKRSSSEKIYVKFPKIRI